MYVAPREAQKVQTRKAAAYGHAPRPVVKPKVEQAKSAMAAMAKVGKNA